MSLARIFFLAIVFYLLYRCIFHLVVPVVRATRQVHEQFKNMQGGMGRENGTGPQQGQQSTQAGNRRSEMKHSSPKGPAEDYIEFEEVK
jgi:hypothetical protein